MDWVSYSLMLAVVLGLGVAAWAWSLVRDNVSHVDGLWSLFFLVIGFGYLGVSGHGGLRAWIVLLLVAAWSLRLSAYITLRNHGQPEDHRYQKIRANNEPGFRFKSLYIVFGLQALLAWLIAMPIAVAMSVDSPLGWLDGLGLALWMLGMSFEVVGDMQLSRFRQDPANTGQVLDRGLWRYTRHPNYFGECALWWGYFCFALAAGGWWTVLSPVLMTLLLLRVSGVSLLEKDIGERRPDYANYIRRTNAFIPGPRRSPAA